MPDATAPPKQTLAQHWMALGSAATVLGVPEAYLRKLAHSGRISALAVKKTEFFVELEKCRGELNEEQESQRRLRTDGVKRGRNAGYPEAA